MFARFGARSAPKLVYGAPSEVFISVNDAAVHGVPGPRRLKRGDLVKIDVTAELGGFYADACVTVPVGPTSPRVRRLIGAADAALERGMAAAVAGARVRDVSAAVAAEAAARGVSVLDGLGGPRHRAHDPRGAVGTRTRPTPANDTRLHEGPRHHDRADPRRRQPGGSAKGGDGWTIRTADGVARGARRAHDRGHRPGRPLVLTA